MGSNMFSQAANRADLNNPLDAQARERPDIGAYGYLGRANAVSPPMARQKGHRYTLYLAYGNHVAGISKGRLYRDLLNIAHPFHVVKTTTTNHANPRLWH